MISKPPVTRETWWLFYQLDKGAMMQKNLKLRHEVFICASCGHIDFPQAKKAGSSLVEITLWLIFLVPGLVYNSWRNANKHLVCCKCGSQEVIELSTPRGGKLAREIHSFKEDIPVIDQLDDRLRGRVGQIAAQRETISKISNAVTEKIFTILGLIFFIVGILLIFGNSIGFGAVFIVSGIVAFSPIYERLSKLAHFSISNKVRFCIVIGLPILRLIF
jgi:hypothetical protein